MTKRDKSEQTRAHIMRTAELLFSQKGFDGTSVDSIAKAAKINKALIYYYFKNKDDLVRSLFVEILEELGCFSKGSEVDDAELSHSAKISNKLEYLSDRKALISILIMETMKQEGGHEFLFQLTERIVEHIRSACDYTTDGEGPTGLEFDQRLLIHEFFTGIMPILSFITLGEKFADYFGFDMPSTKRIFMEEFETTHLSTHLVEVEKLK